jgi:hypothetical protein
MPASRRRIALRLLLLMTAACGGGDSGGTGPTPPPITVAASPGTDTLTVGTSATFTATVTNSSDASVVWSVIGGATHGAITSAGLYSAPGTPGNYLIVAASGAHPASTDTVRVLVVAAPSALISVSDSVPEGQASLVASVTSQAGARYLWTVTGGTLASGQGTSQITFTSGAPGAASVGCTVRNLADSAVTGGKTMTVVAAPSIISFTAARDTVTLGESTTLTAVFANGTGSVDNGVGSVTSGGIAPVGPFVNGANNSFQLIVTGFRGATRTAVVTVVPVPAPSITLLQAGATTVPVGGRGQFFFRWTSYPGFVATISPGIGVIPPLGSYDSYAYVSTPLFASAGPVTFDATVRSPADSIVHDTLTLIAVSPAAGGYTTAGPMLSARYEHAAARLNDGRVLIVGGQDQAGNQLLSAELYDPASRQFTPTGSMTELILAPSAVTLIDGRVLVVGSGLSQLYDPVTGQFAAGPASVLSGFLLPLTRLDDGRVFMLSGFTDRRVEIYDPVADSFAITDSLSAVRIDPTVVKLQDGRLLVAGGYDLSNTPLATVEIYDPLTDHFGPAASAHAAHFHGSFVGLADGRVLAVGGYSAFPSGPFSAAEVFDPGTGQWTVTSGQMVDPREVFTVGLLGDNRVLITGGMDAIGGDLPNDEIFDPHTDAFLPVVGTGGTNRGAPRVVPLLDGSLLLIGGYLIHAQFATATAAAETFR